MDVVWIGSPNFDHNREKIDTIVIHWMDGNLASTDRVFQDKVRGTSAHYGIENNLIHQYVKDDCVAYHAGNYAVNQRSIGIEHSAQPGRDATPETLETSAYLIAKLSTDYDIPLDRIHIKKHSEIKATQCPGTIPIDLIIRRAQEIVKGDTMQPDFKAAFLTLGQSFGDQYNEGWNDGEKAAYIKKIQDKAVDYKHRAENPPQTGGVPQSAGEALVLAGQLLKGGH